MSAWAVKDKTESWDTICDLAWAGEPQFVTRGPSQTVVVISYVDYQPIKPKRRRIIKNPKLAFKISDADLFSDDACNLTVVTGDRRYAEYGVSTIV